MSNEQCPMIAHCSLRIAHCTFQVHGKPQRVSNSRIEGHEPWNAPPHPVSTPPMRVETTLSPEDGGEGSCGGQVHGKNSPYPYPHWIPETSSSARAACPA